MNPNPQIIVLDAGGQYCHLIARKVRDLGVYAEVRASETPASELAGAKGVVISGGPASVYDPGSPTVDAALFDLGLPVLGICYGQQLMASALGGEVRRGEKGEYGLAALELDDSPDPLFAGLSGCQQVWMSHRDVVAAAPPGFSVIGRTPTCAIAAMADPERAMWNRELKQKIDGALGGLTPRERMVFELRHYQGLRLRNIGEVLGTTEEAAKNCLFRATQKMRGVLGDFV